MRTVNILLVLIVTILIGCQSNQPSKGSKIPASKNADSTIVKSTEEEQNSAADNDEGNIEGDQTVYPIDFENKSILIVPNAEFHSDGRDQIETKKEWMGLFKTKSGVYLKNVKATIKTVYDPISDDENGPYTGVKVVPSINNSCELLLNPIGGMKEQKLVCFQSKEKTMFAGDKINFKSNETNYQVYCTGIQKSKDETAEIKDYKLLISSDKYAHAPQLLMQVPPSNEYAPNRISVYLIALIDNDNVPDVILKNGENFFLYLSTSANEGEILSPVGREVLFGGC